MDQIFCRAWPARYDCQDAVLVDRFITQRSDLDHTARIPDEIRYNIKILEKTIPNAQRIEVTVSRIRKDNQLGSESTAYEEATDMMKRNIIHVILDNLVVAQGFSIEDMHAGLLIRIKSGVPIAGPLTIVRGTQITIVKEQEEHSQQSTTTIAGSTSTAHASDLTNSLNVLPGLEGPIKALFEVVSYPLLYPDLIAQLNIECPKGILLHGPPGVGKTLLVSTVAQMCRAQMVTIFGPEIFGPYVGESEEKLRQKFEQAGRLALADRKRPVMIFIDELDALTPHRTDAQAHESRVVAQLLTLMDGVTSRGRVVVIAATNKPNSIDPALRRPGRFDREIRMDVPGEHNRRRIIEGLIKDMPHTLSEDELLSLARMTNGFVGADLEALCRESALSAVHRNIASGTATVTQKRADVSVTMADFKRAFSTNAPSLQRGYGVVVEPVRWTDIGGLESVKTQLRQAVEWPVLYKDTFSRLGLKAPRGILLYGPPGCSKTTLVKAIATNSGSSFLSVNGAALYSSFVGDSEKTIRETFHQARLSAPSIVFFDEIDTIVGKRSFSAGGDGGGGGDSVQERVLSTMLNEMDGVENAQGVLIVAATNRVDLIDKALLRPGRFDRVVYVPPPDMEARRQILSIYTRDIPLDTDVDLDSIAQTNAHDFQQSLAAVKPSLTATMLLEYSSTGQKAF
ncbi:hypothetical protein BGZ98_007441 [Dissophora globulifera]|nr:hypothetical protein BGZ98_007441 [Dissophora globulifera]